MLITSPLIDYAKQQPNKIAIDAGSQKITYREFYDHVEQISHYLTHYRRQNPEAEKKIAFLLPNRIEFLEVFLGAAMSGWIAIPLDPKWSEQELRVTLENCQPQLLLVDEMFRGRFSNSSKSFSIWVKQDNPWKDLEIESMDEGTNQSVSDQFSFYMGFTSGTTGIPKAFVRSHRSWLQSFEGSRIEFCFTNDDHILVPGPLVHSTFLYAAVHALYMGATVVLLDKFSPNKVIHCLLSFPIDVIYMVPTMFEALTSTMEQREVHLEEYPLRNILSAGAKWSPQSKRKVAEAFPQANLYEFYGASELSFITILGPDGNRRKPDSVGRAFHGVELSIRDENGNDVKTGEVGKLYVRSELVFSGYYRNEEETNHVLVRDGWATVHDLGWIDEEGYLYLVGREKNMIIYGGLNVYPEEVEKVIKLLPEIDEAIVLGKPDKYWGERVMAVVRTKQGMQITDREIQVHCRKFLAHYKCPREMIRIAELPYTSSGKIARKLLMDRILDSRSEK
ncbi:MAG TPA: AMP-binding protein [Bacillota bacterium]|nr:AMP-binding protein [Bacillota bacterium]